MAWGRPVAAVLGAVMWLGSAGPARAQAPCTCRVGADAQNAVAADVVFTGVPLGTEPPPSLPAPAPLWSFMVESPIKGKPVSPVVVAAGGRVAPCRFGFDFEVGVRYLVFARRDAQGALWTSVCTGTRDLDQEPRTEPVVFPGGVEVVDNRGSRNALLVVGAGAALALALAAGYDRRRRQQLLIPPPA